MTRTPPNVFWLLVLAANLYGCPSTTELKQTTDADVAQTTAGIFACESALREEKFIHEAAKMGVSRPDAKTLYSYSGAKTSDVVTGFAPAGDRSPTVERAINAEIKAYIAQRGLSEIPHPKHPGDQSKYGAGIIFGVSRIDGQETTKEVYGAADKIVEAKKSQ